MHVEIPYRRFLNEMWGVLLSAAAIVALLVATFLCLLRVMYRQKSLDEMRRDLTHNITHELKTPIAVACAACDALRNFSADADPAKRERYIDMVSVQARATRLDGGAYTVGLAGRAGAATAQGAFRPAARAGRHSGGVRRERRQTRRDLGGVRRGACARRPTSSI